MHVVIYEVDEPTKNYLGSRLPGHEVTYAEATAQDASSGMDAEVMSVFVNSRIDASVLERFPSLKLIATRSTGFDHIDIAACQKRGVVVCNVPSYGERTVAEYAFALLLMLTRKTYQAARRVREEGKFHTDGLTGFDLADKTIGIIGTGHIGCHAIQIANGFGMHVLAYDPFPKPDLEKTCSMKYVSLDELLAQSDVITLHAPYMPATHHLLNVKNMQTIKPGALLINTARGALVETAALVEALHSGRLAGAGLDVLEEEGYVGEEWKLLTSGSPKAEQMATILADHQLMALPNVIITPHNAFNTTEAIERILEITTQNITSFAQGAPQNTVKQ
jgi:D-lactate dehydrogenase